MQRDQTINNTKVASDTFSFVSSKQKLKLEEKCVRMYIKIEKKITF